MLFGVETRRLTRLFLARALRTTNTNGSDVRKESTWPRLLRHALTPTVGSNPFTKSLPISLGKRIGPQSEKLGRLFVVGGL